MKLLVTGFGPFLSHSANPSQLVAEKLDGTRIDLSAQNSITIHSLVRTVDTSGATLQDELHDYQAVIHLGLDASADKIYLETAAMNTCAKSRDEMNQVTMKSDNQLSRRGDCEWPNPIHESLPVVLPTTWPIQGVLLNQLVATSSVGATSTESKVMCSWSRDPGTYFCNEQYYKTLSRVRSLNLTNGKNLVPVIFIHIPLLDSVFTVESISEFTINLIKASELV